MFRSIEDQLRSAEANAGFCLRSFQLGALAALVACLLIALATGA